jgi:hypothetical protein
MPEITGKGKHETTLEQVLLLGLLASLITGIVTDQCVETMQE